VGALGGSASIVCCSYGYAYANSSNTYGTLVLFGTDNAAIRAAIQAWQPYSGTSPPGFPWLCGFNVWALTVSAPGDSDVSYVVAGSCTPNQMASPTVWAWAGPTEISFPASCDVSGLVLCRKRTNASYPGVRTSPMDFTDQTVDDTWFADEDSTVTVTGGGLSASGALAGAGAEVNMGTAFNWWASLVNNYFLSALTSYGRIASPTCFGEDASDFGGLLPPGQRRGHCAAAVGGCGLQRRNKLLG
jgi:hypothetical protein